MKPYQLSELHTKEHDQYLFVLNGEIGINIMKDTDGDEDQIAWNGNLKKGDFVYLPKGVSYQMKTKIKDDEDAENVIYIVLSNQ